MKIAVAMQNEGELQSGHFGQAFRYFIYETTGNDNPNEYKLTEKRENPHYGAHKHAKVQEIEAVLGDCSVWIGSRMGKGSIKYLPTAGITPFLSSETRPEKAVEEFLRQIADTGSGSGEGGSDNAED